MSQMEKKTKFLSDLIKVSARICAEYSPLSVCKSPMKFSYLTLDEKDGKIESLHKTDFFDFELLVLIYCMGLEFNINSNYSIIWTTFRTGFLCGLELENFKTDGLPLKLCILMEASRRFYVNLSEYLKLNFV